MFCKVADVLDTRGLGLDQSTMLGLASVVGASRLMGLTPEQMVHAIGITVGGNTAINQGRVGTLSNWKDFASAEASRKAIFSAQLAQAGMTGPSQVFEGPSGFFNVISRKTFDLPKLGEPFGIMRAFTKRFPLGQYSQTVAEAAAQVRSSFADTDEIHEVNIRVSRNAIKVMADSPDKWRPQSHETADHSMPYATAVVLMYGTIDDHYYEDPYLHDPRLLDLVSRVRCIPSAEADVHEKDYNLCDFEIVLKSGSAEVGPGRIPSRALEKSDDRRRNGGEVSVAGAQASARGTDRCLAAAIVDARGHAEGGDAGRDDQNLGGFVVTARERPVAKLEGAAMHDERNTVGREKQHAHIGFETTTLRQCLGLPRYGGCEPAGGGAAKRIPWTACRVLWCAPHVEQRSGRRRRAWTSGVSAGAISGQTSTCVAARRTQ